MDVSQAIDAVLRDRGLAMARTVALLLFANLLLSACIVGTPTRLVRAPANSSITRRARHWANCTGQAET